MKISAQIARASCRSIRTVQRQAVRASLAPVVTTTVPAVTRHHATILTQSRSFSSSRPLAAYSCASQVSSEPLPEGCHLTIEPSPSGHPGTIATVTMSNPKRLNSLSRDTIASLTKILQDLHYNEEIRAVIIQGGKTATRSQSFTSGANIFQMAALKSYEQGKKFITELHNACKAMRDMPVPTIARIDGLCLGGGLELAAACDFRYATKGSTFSMPETKYGIPSVIEARLLANIIGWQKTKEMVYFARFYEAPEMERWGLVDKCVEDVAELDRVIDEAVETIASFGPLTMREQKRLCMVWEETNLVSGVEAGVDCYARMFADGGKEPGHYMKLFTERKK